MKFGISDRDYHKCIHACRDMVDLGKFTAKDVKPLYECLKDGTEGTVSLNSNDAMLLMRILEVSADYDKTEIYYEISRVVNDTKGFIVVLSDVTGQQIVYDFSNRAFLKEDIEDMPTSVSDAFKCALKLDGEKNPHGFSYWFHNGSGSVKVIDLTDMNVTIF